MRPLLALALGWPLVSFAAPAPARAQSAGETRAAAAPAAAIAEDLFRRGRTALKEGRVADACALFAESLAAEEKLGTLLNLARCHERQGRTATAWVEFVRAETLARRTDQSERRAYAAKRAAALRQRLTRLRLDLGSLGGSATVRLDGRPLPRGAFRSSFPVDPGVRELEVTAGARRWRRRVDAPDGPITVTVAGPGDATWEEVRSGKRKKVLPVLPSSPDPRPMVIGFGAGALALGVIGLGVGTGFGVRTLDLDRQSDAFCDGTACSAEGVDIVDRAFASATVSTVSFVAGGISAGIGLTLLSVGLAMEAEADQKPASALRVDAGVGGLHVGGAW